MARGYLNPREPYQKMYKSSSKGGSKSMNRVMGHSVKKNHRVV